MKNLPNILSIIRIVLVPIFLLFVLLDSISCNLYIALIIFCVAALTDFLDGMIARKYNLITNIGKFLDPIADKILMLSGILSILYIQFSTNILPLEFVYITFISIFIIIARDYMVDVIRQISSSMGHVIPADKFGKLKTVVQDIAVPMLLLFYALALNSGFYDGANLIFGYISYAIFLLGVVLTILSGVNYLVKNVDIFSKNTKGNSLEKGKEALCNNCESEQQTKNAQKQDKCDNLTNLSDKNNEK